MHHANARLTVHGRRELITRIQCGRPIAHVAADMGISRANRVQVVGPVAPGR